MQRLGSGQPVYLETRETKGGTALALKGRWRAENVADITEEIDRVELGVGSVGLDGAGLESLDLTGAWLIRRLEERLKNAGLSGQWLGEPPEAIAVVAGLEAGAQPAPVAPAPRLTFLETVGELTVERLQHQRDALDFLGRVIVSLGEAARHLSRLRPAAISRHVVETGIEAIPIVALIAFLISVIVAYIGAEELRQFGGEVFVVDLVTISVLRELGVLLTAIIVAGRSGSAFAAEIGVMQLNEEVDALRSMGVNPIEALVNPRVLGLIIALPCLTVIADAMGISGGAVLSWLLLDIPFNRFIVRMHEALSHTTFWAGLLKAPVFAAAIAMIGTYRGLQVRESSRELGRLTTVAVVQAIFMVLLIDAVFAVVYWKLNF